MAAERGARLLAENERNTCTLDQIFLQLKSRHGPPDHQITRIDAVDSLIRAFLLSRPGPALPRSDVSSGEGGNSLPPLPRPPVVEIDGVGPASGRTQLLYLAAARCLLGGISGAADASAPPLDAPEAAEEPIAEEPTAGTSRQEPHAPTAVVWMDLSGRFSASRLFDILKGEIRRQRASISDDNGTSSNATRVRETEDLALGSLRHVHIFRPQSTPALIATLSSLPSYLFSPPPTHLSQGRPFGLMILSGLSSFWWQDRHDAELDALGMLTPYSSQAAPVDTQQAPEGDPEQDPDLVQATAAGMPTAATTSAADHPSGLSASRPQQQQQRQDSKSLYFSRWRQFQAALRSIQMQFRIPVLASDMALAGTKRRGKGRGSHRGSVLSAAVPPHLPGSWSTAVTARLLVRRVRRSFPPAISAVEALEEVEREKEWHRRRKAEKEREKETKAGADDGGGDDVSESDDDDDDAAITESEIMVNMHDSEDWSRATWAEMETWRARRVVLRIGPSRVVVGSEEARRRR